MSPSVVTTIFEDDLAIVTINYPPFNVASHAVRAQLIEAITQTNENTAIQAVLLTCAGSTFVASADIKEYDNPLQAPSLSTVIDAIEKAPVPWVAVINGTALGGGLELALGCRFRLCDNKANFGFREVNLGLIPGAGGTYRLPRLIAMQEALNLITTGKPINARKAQQLGLIDEVFSKALLTNAKEFTRANVIRSERLPTSEQDIVSPIRRTGIEKALSVAKRRKQIAKAAAIDTISRSAVMAVKDAAALERQTFLELLQSDQSKALQHLFFAERSVPIVADLQSVEPRSIAIVGIIGGGTMGTGIAASALLSGFTVVLVERDTPSVERAQRNIEKTLQDSLAREIITQEKFQNALSNFSTSAQFSSLSNADLAIEAVFEDLQIKNEVFKKLDEVTKPSAVLATNTSYFDVSVIANQTNIPSRVVGLHYFSPAHIMKLVEVIRTESVAPEVFATALQFAKSTKKIAVPAGVCRGFIANRIMSAYRQTCEHLLEDGALPHQVDTAMKAYGFPIGIFEMQDLAGLDIGWAMRKQLTAAEKHNTRYVEIADKICEAKRFGRKTGSGFYKYEDGKTAQRDEWIEQLILAESTRKGIVRCEFSRAEIIDAILASIKDEAEAILQEGIADSPEAIDVVMVNGFGFPRWRGGPMYAASTAKT